MAGDWIELRRCHWLHEAQFLRSLLAGAGIESFIPGGSTPSVQPLHFAARADISLLVRPADVERANEVLASAAIDHDQDRNT
jgi:hypothetical protein